VGIIRSYAAYLIKYRCKKRDKNVFLKSVNKLVDRKVRKERRRGFWVGFGSILGSLFYQKRRYK